VQPTPGVYGVGVASEREVEAQDGRTLRAYDSGGADGAFTIVWHHGSPQTGAPLEPLLAAAAARGIRLVSYARPSYGGSSPHVGRDVASAAGDVARIADALGVGRFAVMGASGGLRAALDGREARARHAASDEFDPESFTAADWAALEATWASLGDDAVRASQAGLDGLIDDDIAYVAPWGFDLAAIAVPVLVVQGGEDRVVPAAHADWLVRACPRAELWLRPREGHVSILDACPVAMDWLVAAAG
jgi:pimeloyl-ACP methyl ester carboxylesterase